MSTESLAAFRKSVRDELSNLAEERMQHDLRQSDRDALRRASSKLSTHATIGSFLGLGLGIFMAFKARGARISMFNAFRAKEKPTRVQFADGRTGRCSHLSSYTCLLVDRTRWTHPFPDLGQLVGLAYSNMPPGKQNPYLT